jgi:hypothetical protein
VPEFESGHCTFGLPELGLVASLLCLVFLTVHNNITWLTGFREAYVTAVTGLW